MIVSRNCRAWIVKLEVVLGSINVHFILNSMVVFGFWQF